MVQQFAALLGPHGGGGVEDGQGLVGDGRGPRLGEGGVDRGARADIGLDNVATGSGREHVTPVERNEIDDADALRRFAALQQLQDNVSAHEAYRQSHSRKDQRQFEA